MAQWIACANSKQFLTNSAEYGRSFAIRRRLFILPLAVLALILTVAAPRIAEAKYAAFVVDAGTGVVRHEANADERNPPASLTKLMTLYLLFEALENKRLSWNTQMTVSRHAANQSPTHLALAPGETISVHDATLAVVIHSANDAAVVIAETLGETEEKFALKMTEKARKIGMNRTTFRNASGLPNPGQLSTARDMATLAQAIMDRFPQYYPMFSESSFSYRGRVYRSHNRVTLNYAGADGLKTGYTNASGFNLVTSAVRDGHRLIGVVFGGNTASARDQQMMKLLDQAFASRRGTGPLMVKNTVGTEPQSKAKVRAAAVQQTEIQPKAKSKKKTVVAEGDTDAGASTGGDRPDWGIQVGAFYSRAPAEATARDVAQKYGKLLKGGQVNVASLAKAKGRTLYRSRIMGIDKDAAYEACKLLKRAQVPCMELRGSDDEVVER